MLETRRTRFQDLALFRHPVAGKILALDGIVQLTEIDTHVYHEVLTHPALCAHPEPRTVAVVGGGDAFVVAEALKHDTVEKVYLLELDEDVIEVSRKHYPETAAALADPRVEVRVDDAFESIASMHDELDVILVDLTDPIGHAARLFADPFYERCHNAMRAEGLLVAQTESVHFHPEDRPAVPRRHGRAVPHRRAAVGRDGHLSRRLLDVRLRLQGPRPEDRPPRAPARHAPLRGRGPRLVLPAARRQGEGAGLDLRAGR